MDSLQIITALSTVLLGGVIGYFSALLLERRKNTIQWNIKTFDLYNQIVKELLSLCSEIASLDLRYRHYDEESVEGWRNQISDFCLQYYNVLPQAVISELICLHTCLSSKGKAIYKIDKKQNLLAINSDNELCEFFDHISHVSNNNKLTGLVKRYGYQAIPNHIKINFQARAVIKKVDEYFRHEDIHRWSENLKKKTLHEIRTAR